MQRKNSRNSTYYISIIWNVLIYGVLILMLLGISFFIYWILKSLLIYVFCIEQAVGDLVSLIVSIFFFVFPLIPKIKHFYIRLVNIFQQKVYNQIRKKTFPRDLKTTTEQAAVINRVLGLLKNDGSHLIALEGAPNKGKTMTAVFLIDNIGKDGNLLELFIQLQQHIYYIDAGYEKAYLMNYLDDNTVVAKSLTIIDNVHKLSSEALINVLNKITAISEYADSFGSKHLIILLYQSIYSNSTSHLLHDYLTSQHQNNRELFLKLNADSHFYSTELKSNQRIDTDGVIFDKICAEHSELLRTHLLNVYVSANSSTLVNYLLSILDMGGQENRLIESDLLQLITIVVALSMHLGFVTKDAMLKIWENLSPQCGKAHCQRLIKSFSRGKFMQPFPLMPNAFLFNESLAHEYKKRLFSIELFREYYYQCANYIYKTNYFNSIELDWLFLIACRPCEVQAVPKKIREKLFYSCIEAVNQSYVLAALEEEVSLDAQKQYLFQEELGILYIKTGQWTQARQVLKPYIFQEKVPSKIYQLQLQIIEADHGVNDAENLSILSNISSMSGDPYTQFQAHYWTAHIKMEQGDFSLTVWKELQTSIKGNSTWRAQHTYPHLIHRIAADSCRTFFLKGAGDFAFFNQTMDFLKTYRSKPYLQEDLALEELENAHYIHYELVYQLGIWRMYRFPHDRERSFEDSICLNGLIEKALKMYDGSIAQFLKAGAKTWRTAQIRRSELALCSVLPNYIEIMSQLGEFERYACDNHVDVFNGYIACLQGKALAIYALSEAIGNEDNSYERSLEDSLNYLKKSIYVYNCYGNTFGELRSKMLYILVNTIKKIGTSEDPVQILEYFTTELENIKKSFSEDNIREQQVLDYLIAMPSLKIADVGNVIKYYPIVLQ